MAAPEDILIPGNKSLLPTITSMVVPGSGQFLLGHRWKGLVILLTTAILTFLVNWALVNLNIGQVSLGSSVTSWLWIPLILFWVWNVLDTHSTANGKTFSSILGLLFAALILYFIAWNVTDVRLDRLVTRFGDA